MRSPDHEPDVRRVVLPSGKTIEVVYFADRGAGAVALPPTPVPVPGEDLHVCPDCSSELVYPVAWDEAGDAAWMLELRCPNCEWHGEGVHDQLAVEALDEELDRGTQALVRDLKGLLKANMEEEVDRFIRALHADAIWPIDF